MVKFKTNCQGVWCPHKEGGEEEEERRGKRRDGWTVENTEKLFGGSFSAFHPAST